MEGVITAKDTITIIQIRILKNSFPHQTLKIKDECFMVPGILRIYKADPFERPLFLIIWPLKAILLKALITEMEEVSKV